MTVELSPLVEYESTRVRLTDHQARRLADAAAGAVSVASDPEAGWWPLAAQEMFGTLVVDDVRLLIRPKIRPENLFLLLEVGCPSLPGGGKRSTSPRPAICCRR